MHTITLLRCILYKQVVVFWARVIFWVGLTSRSVNSATAKRTMLRRTAIVLAKPAAQTGRTIVRDPRKKKAVTSVVQHHAQEQQQPPQQYQSKTQVQTPLPFSPSDQNQQSVGSSLGSYMLAGVGVALGVTLVRVVIGFWWIHATSQSVLQLERFEILRSALEQCTYVYNVNLISRTGLEADPSF